MQHNEQFMVTSKTPKPKFEVLDLQVDEVLGKCTRSIEPNVCHYYVDIKGHRVAPLQESSIMGFDNEPRSL
jgi:hypothetical protein